MSFKRGFGVVLPAIVWAACSGPAPKPASHDMARPPSEILHCSASSSWVIENAQTKSLVNAMWGSSAADIYVVAAPGIVSHSTGDGTWSVLHFPRAATLFDYETVWGSGPSNVYIGGGELYRSTDGGGTWTVLQGPATTAWGLSAADLFGVSADTFVEGADAALFHSTDGGNTWMKSYVGLVTSVWGTSAADLYLATNGGLKHSINDGATWQPLTNAPSCREFAGTVGNVLCASQDVYRSIDGGQNWTSLHAAVPAMNGTVTIRGLWASSDGSTIFAVGSSSMSGTNAGLIVHSSDGGITWAADDSCGAINFNAVWGSSADDVYVALDFDYVLHRRH